MKTLSVCKYNLGKIALIAMALFSFSHTAQAEVVYVKLKGPVTDELISQYKIPGRDSSLQMTGVSEDGKYGRVVGDSYSVLNFLSNIDIVERFYVSGTYNRTHFLPTINKNKPKIVKEFPPESIKEGDAIKISEGYQIYAPIYSVQADRRTMTYSTDISHSSKTPRKEYTITYKFDSDVIDYRVIVAPTGECGEGLDAFLQVKTMDGGVHLFYANALTFPTRAYNFVATRVRPDGTISFSSGYACKEASGPL